jgi:polyisoprenoid-binding protein YceI
VTRYVLVADQSLVTIEASSSVHPIHSQTRGIRGWIDADMTKAGHIAARSTPSAHLELAVDSLRSGNPLEDREMSRRMDTRRFPTITGDAHAFERVDGAAGHYRVTGDVTMKGVTCPHADEVTIEAGPGGQLRIEGSSVWDVRDFGMQPPRILMLRVHPEVRVTIDLLAVPADGAPR